MKTIIYAFLGIVFVGQVFGQTLLISNGTSTAYTINFPANTGATIPDGFMFTFKAHISNTGTTTLSVNGSTPSVIKKNGSIDIGASDLISNRFYTVIYDNTNAWWQLLSVPENGTGGVSGVGVNSAVPFWTGSSSQSADAANFVWDNTNKRLGIGTNTPSTPLHIVTPNPVGDGIQFLAPNLTDNNITVFVQGRNPSFANQAEYRFRYVGNGNVQNAHAFGFNAIQPFVFFTANERVGIGVANPLNKLDVLGSMALGAYAGVNTPPANSLIVSGNIGIGQTNPIHKIHVNGGNIFGDQAYVASTRSIAASTTPFNTGAQSISQVRITDNGSALANGNLTYGATAVEGQYLWITNFDNESVTFTSAFAPNVIPPFSTRCFVFVGGSQWNMVGAPADNLGNHTATTQILGTNGTAALPSYTFNSNQNTGLYLINTNILGIATGGTNRILFDGFGHSVTPPSANGFTINVGGAAAFGIYGTLDPSAANAPTNGLVVSGNVGIGTSTPGQNLVVVGNTSVTGIGYFGTIAGLALNGAPAGSITTVDGAGRLGFGTLTAGLSGTGTNGAVNFWTGANTQSADATNFFWDNTNKRLGIGTNAPQSRLVLTQTIANGGFLKLENPNNNSGDTWWIGFPHGAGSGDANDRARIGVNMQVGGAGEIFFSTGTGGSQTERMRIGQTGNVGIGTSTPNTRLHVVGNSTVTGIAMMQNAQIASLSNGVLSVNGTGNVVLAPAGSSLSGTGTNGAVNFWTGANTQSADAANFFWDNTNKRLGIGTNAPISELSIFNPTNNFPQIVVGSPGTYIGVLFDKLTGTGKIQTVLNQFPIQIGYDGSQFALHISNSVNQGRVGIGTENPNQKLTVNGNISTSGISFMQNAQINALANGVLSVNGTGQVVLAPAGSSLSGSGTNGAINFWTGTNTQSADATNLFWDNTNKRLGIGNNTPLSKLDVNGSLAVGVGFAGVVVAPANGLIVNGNVGIGIPTPASIFHVRGTSPFALIDANATLQQSSIVFGENGVTKWQLGKQTNNTFFIYDQDNTRDAVQINTNGNITLAPTAGSVGIGITTPNAKLDVGGNVSNNLQAIFARGVADPNFYLRVKNASASLQAIFGLEYTGGFDNASINFYRGGTNFDGFMAFSTQGVDRMTIYNNGNVGIGTSTPTNPLHINTINNVANWIAGNFGTGTGGDRVVVGNNLGKATVGGHNNALDQWADLVLNPAGAGNVGINTGVATISYKLEVNGAVAGQGAYVNLSDKRIKKNIKNIENPLLLIQGTKGVYYDWDTTKIKIYDDNQHQIGFLAQDLLKVIPEAVSYDKAKDRYSVAYSKLIPILTEAMKEQQKMIDELQKENSTFKIQNTRLIEQTSALQSQIDAIKKQLGLNLKSEK